MKSNITYEDGLRKKNKDLKKTIKSSKEELEKLKKELEEKETNKNGDLFTYNSKPSTPGIMCWDDVESSFKTISIDTKTAITEDSFPITIEMKSQNIEITLEDVIKIRTLLDRKPWYIRIWAIIQKMWKRETKS